MSHAAHFADNFPKTWRRKRLLPTPKRLLGTAGAAMWRTMWKALLASGQNLLLNTIEGEGTILDDRQWDLVPSFLKLILLKH
jgi:hypothetical protein